MAKFEGSAKISKKEGDTSINVSLGKKGFFEKIAENMSKRMVAKREENQKICKNCGVFMDKPFALCAWDAQRLMYDWQKTHLCKDCAKKCRKCGKYFCLEHLKKHKCI
ncbi:hypothetical protein HYU07_04310 [Candidatus Woesearchaeota archaeon]|nr:hypothetical protein [Candidatus Woesearchaeota archaeon]